MRKIYFITLIILSIFILSCNETELTNSITNLPEVSIIYPTNNSVVEGIVNITAVATDVEGVDNVSFLFNGIELVESQDYEIPYQYHFDTTEFENNYFCTFTAKVTDTDENIKYSDPISLTIYNPNNPPAKVALSLDCIDNSHYQFSWTENFDEDFSRYVIYTCNEINAPKTIIYESNEQSSTSIELQNVDIMNKYVGIFVEDKAGLISESNHIFVSMPEKPLLSYEIIEFLSVRLNWSLSTETDLHSYKVYTYYDEDLNGKELIYETENINENFLVLENLTEGKHYYSISIEDSIGLFTESNVVDVEIIGQTNKVLSFDGIDDKIYFQESNNMNISGDLTISFWMKVDNSGIQPTIVGFASWGETDAVNAMYDLHFKDDSRFIEYVHEYGNGSNETLRFTDFLFNFGQWYHVALVRDTQLRTVKLYVNGSLRQTESYLINPNGGSEGQFSIAENRGLVTPERFFKGDLDDMQIWSAALNNSQIIQIMNEEINLDDTNLKAFFDFEEEGQFIFDYQESSLGILGESDAVEDSDPTREEEVIY